MARWTPGLVFFGCLSLLLLHSSRTVVLGVAVARRRVARCLFFSTCTVLPPLTALLPCRARLREHPGSELLPCVPISIRLSMRQSTGASLCSCLTVMSDDQPADLTNRRVPQYARTPPVHCDVSLDTSSRPRVSALHRPAPA
jgi:hypothetical protein